MRCVTISVCRNSALNTGSAAFGRENHFLRVEKRPREQLPWLATLSANVRVGRADCTD